jgi:hypothetical protein
MEPPVWMLDIDGVINANKPGWGEAPRRRIIGGFPVRWAPKLIVRMKKLQAANLVEIRWSTTWCGSPWELGMLAMTVGLDCAPAFTERPPHKTWGDMKAEAALDVLASGRRLIWTDDDEVGEARWLFPQFEEEEEEGRDRGLQPNDLDAIEAFATQHNGSEA